MGMTRTLTRVCLAAAALALAGCGADKSAPEEAPPVAVSLATVAVRPVEDTVDAYGTVESQVAPQVAAEVAGRIEKILVETGDKVRAGQPLALIQTSDYATDVSAQRANLRRLEAERANLRQTLARNESLARQGFLSSAALDNTRTQLKALNAQIEQAGAGLSQSSRNLSRTTVRSPVDGVVQSRLASAGDYARAGQPLFVIATEQAQTVHLPLPENLADRLKPGMTVHLATPVRTGTFDSVISELRPMIGTGNRAVEAIVPLPPGLSLPAGASVDGRVVLATRPAALVVPDESVVIRPAGQVVYTVQSGRAVAHTVQTGARQGGWVEIRAGLTAGEQVIKGGAGFLSNGARVQVVRSAS